MIQLTKLENDLLTEIMENELDGVGMGYSEYDGEGISNQTKGVLSSLIQKGVVYNAFDGDDDETPMYCTTELRDNIQIK